MINKTQLFADTTGLLKEAVFNITGSLGRVLTSGLWGMLTHAFWGVMVAFSLVFIYRATWLLGVSPQAIDNASLWFTLYLVMVGVVGGMLTGVTAGVKKGAKKILLGNTVISNLYRSVVFGGVKQVKAIYPDIKDLPERLAPAMEDWANCCRDYQLHTFQQPESGGLLGKIKNNLQQAYLRSMVESFHSYVGEARKMQLGNPDEEQTIDRITRFCMGKTDVFIEQSIDQLFMRPLAIGYSTTGLLLAVPIVFLLIG